MATDRTGPSENGYVPDPERDTAALVDGFLDHIAATQSLPDDTVGAMRAEHARLESENAHLIVDEPARYNLRMTVALVAAYRFLLPALGRDAALAVIEAAFVEPLREFVGTGTRAMLDAAPDPFAAMVAMSKAREKDAFGAGFTFRRPADDDERYLLDVHRCFYHEVLVANSAPELTPVMCAFDRNWIDAIAPETDGFVFERVTTIGHGGTHCPFHFRRTGG